MIKISKATKKEALNKDWQIFTRLHYGPDAVWQEKPFRFKAVEDGRLLGTIEGRYEPGVLYIAALMVKESARGQGIGTMLIKRAEEFGKKLGAHRSLLFAGKDWSNRAFYDKLGFKIIGTLPDFYFHKDFVIYTRPIKNHPVSKIQKSKQKN